MTSILMMTLLGCSDMVGADPTGDADADTSAGPGSVGGHSADDTDDDGYNGGNLPKQNDGAADTGFGDTGEAEPDAYTGTLSVDALIAGTSYGDSCTGDITVEVGNDGVSGAATCTFSGLAPLVGIPKIDLSLSGEVAKDGSLSGTGETTIEGTVVEDAWSGTITDDVLAITFSGSVSWSDALFGNFDLDYEGTVDASL